MEIKTEQKTGTFEDLQKDLDDCGFKESPIQLEANVESVMAIARMKLDTAVRNILNESGLSLSLFDYVIMSVIADIRKADADNMAINTMSIRPMEDSINASKDTDSAR